MAKQEVLASLRKHAEEKYNGGFCMVYLDNARLPHIDDITFRSCLSQLAKDGLYKQVDGYAWGQVKLED